MNQLRQNYYGSLCTEMYEILHEKATQDELDFYVSYAEKGDKILEALCGSGRFLVPFMEYGFDNWGIDFSSEMLIYEERYASKYAQPQGYAYAICLKEDNFPIGYIKVDMEEHHDFGYGLRKEFWHKGIVTEAGKAVVEQVKKDGLPYITATHDKNNPRSGNIMKKVGMKYCYSYEEQWQPKDISVIFRMYQLNFDGNTDFVYQKYWNESDNQFIEKL